MHPNRWCAFGVFLTIVLIVAYALTTGLLVRQMHIHQAQVEAQTGVTDSVWCGQWAHNLSMSVAADCAKVPYNPDCADGVNWNCPRDSRQPWVAALIFWSIFGLVVPIVGICIIWGTCIGKLAYCDDRCKSCCRSRCGAHCYEQCCVSRKGRMRLRDDTIQELAQTKEGQV